MSLGSDEVARAANEVETDRTLTYSVYCERCGYNLRHAPYVGVCPECGGGYNARPLAMKGIFTPGTVRFPSLDIFLSIVCMVLGAVLIADGIDPVQDWLLIIGGIFAVLGLKLMASIYRDARRYFRMRRVMRQIEAEEDD